MLVEMPKNSHLSASCNVLGAGDQPVFRLQSYTRYVRTCCILQSEDLLTGCHFQVPLRCRRGRARFEYRFGSLRIVLLLV